jgi:fructose/tagatose bisphosphate aldolase
MSVAAGNIHGAVAEATRHQKKPEARLDIAHIAALSQAGGIPLVLHGGSGISQDYIRQGIAAGIAKINVATEIRQTYERELTASCAVDKAREAVYRRTREILAAMTSGRGVG